MDVFDKIKEQDADAAVSRRVEMSAERAAVTHRARKSTGWLRNILAVVLACGLAAWAYKTFTPAPDSQPGENTRHAASARPTVGVAAATLRDVPIVVNALGTVTPLATTTVVTQISGQLQQVAFQEGETVKAGQFLAQVDPRPYQALQAKYEGQLAHDQGLLAQAKADDTRYQQLLKANSIARQLAENQAFVVAQYEGTVKADQADVDAQKLNVSYCHITSPIDGRVGLRLIDPGNYVQAGNASGIAVITQMQPISVIFNIAEDDLTDIAPKLMSGAKMEVELFDRGNVKKLGVGEVTTLDNQIDTATGTIKLRALFDNADNKLFPNQFANVRVRVGVLRGAATIPTAAVQRGAQGAFAYVLDSDNKVSVRTLTLGPADGDIISVEKGLSAGERVVTDGADRLRDGSSVVVASGGASAHSDAPHSDARDRRRAKGGDDANGPK